MLKRTATCGELAKKDIKKEVILNGWVHSRRDHGGIIFVDVRDRYGITQLVFDPKHNKEAHAAAEKFGREYVIAAKGVVRYRGKGLENPKLRTGDIEVIVSQTEILNKSETPPLEIDDQKEAGEDVRLQYRYLDLRRPIMQQRLQLRHHAIQAARGYLNSQGFIEIQTPMLVRPTPEGARDYIVPSRVNMGKFYALPQSPQLYKQILMIAGFDKYYQLPAICLRDEDLRTDRQPEHTQMDLEMSFVTEDDIFAVIEGMVKQVMKQAIALEIKTPFQRMTYAESMEKYGSDKPDLRFGLEIVDVTTIAHRSDFQIFKKSAMVKCLPVPHDFSRNELDKLTSWAISQGSKGLAWARVADALESSITKYFPEPMQKELIKAVQAKKGHTLFFMAGGKEIYPLLAKLRTKLAEDLSLIKKEFRFCWITDFPMFEWSEELQKWEPMHHIFTAPKEEHIQFLESDPGKVHGRLYDLTLNGLELLSGSIRINKPELQERVMKVIGLAKEEAYRRFGFLLEAYRYGGPPHGGVGFGFDRFVAILAGVPGNDIREVIAFPKNKAAQCPMDGSPADVDPIQLKEAHIKLDVVKRS
ncbi:aspartate--tRNA ligase [Candidatus Woesearchaeota archaeon]|nr:aspartate--tRNA ligase [Candidatus Woesearchaeota archaeon]